MPAPIRPECYLLGELPADRTLRAAVDWLRSTANKSWSGEELGYLSTQWEVLMDDIAEREGLSSTFLGAALTSLARAEENVELRKQVENA